MANKEILQLDIDDSAFSAFKQKFDAYEAAVKTMPKHWNASSTEITVHRTNFEKMVAGAGSLYRSMEPATISQSTSSRMLDATGVAWAGIWRSGKLFRSDIVHATQSLMHWTKLTAVFSGIIGAGGLFGINRMAASVAGQRTSATGLGISYGEQASFLTNFGRLGNAEGILQGFSEAETDVSKRYALRQYLGHGESGDPAKDFAEVSGGSKPLWINIKIRTNYLGQPFMRVGMISLALELSRPESFKACPLQRSHNLDVAIRAALPGGLVFPMLMQRNGLNSPIRWSGLDARLKQSLPNARLSSPSH